MDIRTASIILGVLALLSLYFTVRVLMFQIPLLKVHDNKLDRQLRFLFFFLAVTLFIGNTIFLIIDAATVYGSLTRSTRELNPVGILYSFSVSGTYTIATGILYLFYRLIASDNARRKRL